VLTSDKFVAVALAAAKKTLRPPLSVSDGAAPLYELTVDAHLRLSVDPRRPTRGDSADFPRSASGSDQAALTAEVGEPFRALINHGVEKIGPSDLFES
jgi:hypothetical protein